MHSEAKMQSVSYVLVPADEERHLDAYYREHSRHRMFSLERGTSAAAAAKPYSRPSPPTDDMSGEDICADVRDRL